jgi:hypothetical protein
MSTEGKLRRNYVFKHNAMKGHAAMMLSHAQNVLKSSSATDDAKATAFEIVKLARILRVQLEERID